MNIIVFLKSLALKEGLGDTIVMTAVCLIVENTILE